MLLMRDGSGEGGATEGRDDRVDEEGRRTRCRRRTKARRAEPVRALADGLVAKD